MPLCGAGGHWERTGWGLASLQAGGALGGPGTQHVSPPQSMDTEAELQFRPRTGKAASAPLLPEVETYLQLLLVIFLMNSKRYPEVRFPEPPVLKLSSGHRPPAPGGGWGASRTCSLQPLSGPFAPAMLEAAPGLGPQPWRSLLLPGSRSSALTSLPLLQAQKVSDDLMQKISSQNRRALDLVVAKCYYYHSRIYEFLNKLDVVRR